MIMIGPIIIIIQNGLPTGSSAIDGADNDELPVVATCEFCTWRGSYENDTKAAQAKGRHRGHCQGNPLTQYFSKPNHKRKR
jgi:hypothetical protein